MQCKSLLLIALLAFSVLSQVYDCGFDQFIQEYNKDYSPGTPEYDQAKQFFTENCQRINRHNSDPKQTYTMQVHAGLDQEWQGPEEDLEEDQQSSSDSTEDSRPSLSTASPRRNLVEFNTGTAGDQGQCLSSVAFAVTSLYEYYLQQRGFYYELSEQALLQCSDNYTLSNLTNDCFGMYLEDALNMAAQVGIQFQAFYPYISGSWGIRPGYNESAGICDPDNRRVKNGEATIANFSGTTSAGLRQIINEVGPVVAMVSSNTPFKAYSGGIFSDCSAILTINTVRHAVVVEGFSDADQYWLIKSSYGQTWGEAGRMRMSYSNNCGLTIIAGGLTFTSLSDNPAGDEGDNFWTWWRIAAVAAGGFMLLLLLLLLCCWCCACCCWRKKQSPSTHHKLHSVTSSSNFSDKPYNVSSDPPNSSAPPSNSEMVSRSKSRSAIRSGASGPSGASGSSGVSRSNSGSKSGSRSRSGSGGRSSRSSRRR